MGLILLIISLLIPHYTPTFIISSNVSTQEVKLKAKNSKIIEMKDIESENKVLELKINDFISKYKITGISIKKESDFFNLIIGIIVSILGASGTIIYYIIWRKNKNIINILKQ